MPAPPVLPLLLAQVFVRTSYPQITSLSSLVERTLQQTPSSFVKHSWIKLLPIVQIFSTADLRKSLDLVSVLMRLHVLSDQLSI